MPLVFPAAGTTPNTPSIAATARVIRRLEDRSPNRRNAMSNTSAGCMAGINVATAMDVALYDSKLAIIEKANSIPGPRA